MGTQNHRYLLELQFLGFRYHGWQKQPDVKTVQHMVDRTLTHILEDKPFKTLGSSRTDTMVSALQHMSVIFSPETLDLEELLINLNKNLPADIRAISLKEVGREFQIINTSKSKEYYYFFSFGEKPHPFSSPFMVNFQEDLDIELMQKAARVFEGTHNFKQYCYRPNEKKIFERSVDSSFICENTVMTGDFFPENSFIYKVKAAGFLHHQVRLMIGTLLKLGMGAVTYDEFLESLKGEGDIPIGFIAPASGLMLYKTEFNL